MKIKIICIFTLLLGVTALKAQTQKQWRDSLNTINRQLTLHPDSIQLQLQKANINLQLLEWEDAAQICNEVLKKDTLNLSALYYRAYANNNMRRYELAKNDYEDFLKISPRNMQARLGLAYTFIKLNRNVLALDQMNNLVEMFPDSSIVYAARAELEKEMKSYETAVYDWDEALKREPGNQDYSISKAETLICLNRKREAKDILDKLVKNGVARGTLKELYAKCK